MRRSIVLSLLHRLVFPASVSWDLKNEIKININVSNGWFSWFAILGSMKVNVENPKFVWAKYSTLR
jgi:hypothetical protein